MMWTVHNVFQCEETRIWFTLEKEKKMLDDKKRKIKKRINCYSIERRALQVATSDVCALLLKLLFSAKQIKNIFILECVQINSFFPSTFVQNGNSG